MIVTVAPRLDSAEFQSKPACVRPGCEAPPEWRPVLLWPVYVPGLWPIQRKFVHGHFHMGMCSAHREEMSVEHLVTDEGFEAARGALAEHGLILGGRSLVGLQWLPINAPIPGEGQ